MPRRSPARSFLGGAYHGTVGFFSQEVPFSWLIATVIMGVAILCAWEYKTPRYEQFAESPSPSTVQQPPEPKPEYVGRITGMADCRGGGSSVPLPAASHWEASTSWPPACWKSPTDRGEGHPSGALHL